MLETHLRLPEEQVWEDLWPRLKGRVFHVTMLSNLDDIQISGEIRPNPDRKLVTTFGSSNSFFRNRRCVSLFDYRSFSGEEPGEVLDKCSPTQPLSPDDPIAILILRRPEPSNLLPWTLWKDHKAFGETVVPYVEAGHSGAISLTLVEELIYLEVEENPNSFSALMSRRRRQRS